MQRVEHCPFCCQGASPSHSLIVEFLPVYRCSTCCCFMLFPAPAAQHSDVSITRLQLLQEQHYSPAVFEDLVSRFEPPNANTRWDSPLHIARPASSPSPAEAASAVAGGLRTNPAAVGSALADGPLATVSRNLTPNLATSQAPRASATALHKVDRAAQVCLHPALCISRFVNVCE